ncbi:MAG: hypothetical protein ACLU37_06215 [Collinsella sp.]
MSAAWRELDYEAPTLLRILARSCPHAAEALYFQTEFPDGVYARVNVASGSTDELVLALSEATPVLQEGLGAPTTPALPPGSPPTISCVPKSMNAYCARPNRDCRLREETSNGSERLHPRLSGAHLSGVAPRTHRCSTRACP